MNKKNPSPNKLLTSRLDRVQDWPSKIQAGHYSARAITKLCSISMSQLGRYCLARFNKTPQAWINEIRMQDAVTLLSDPALLHKEIADRLGYDYPATFCHHFKRHFGCSLREFIKKNGNGASNLRSS